MPYVSERGTLLNSRPWRISRLPEMFWDFFNVVYLFFRTLIEPLSAAGQGISGSRSGSGRGPPRPPRGGFRSFSDAPRSPGNFPAMGG